MADISLRAYLKEIDELIERDQLDEAIAHARHILQNYPKHLDTYRLLGKAYLEAKRFGDAADIFQRVLSAVPDDFVSHIGMAIVREDEGNIDSAVWHMERAFETNPANPAIRQELSRLIGKRDGIEPHKIRLTRGALARQYAQGELYPQAIAELRSALQEDPDRPELEVLLAKMYWRAGQPKESSDISKQILERLPFSYEANRIMAAIYEEEGRSDKAGDHHRRLAALEPYAAFSDSSSIDPTSVDANAVRIDHLEWIPGQPLPSGEPGQPDWVASLGVDLTTHEDDVVEQDDSPPWLTEIEHVAPAQGEGPPITMEAETGQEPSGEAPTEDTIPEWMKDAGWGPSSGEIQETPVSFSDSELDALEAGVMPNEIPEVPEDDGELAPAEIPSWLQDKAPPQPDPESAGEREQTEATPASEGAMPDWLSEIADEADEVVPDPTAGGMPSEAPQAEQEPAAAAVSQSAEDADSPEVPSWIDDLSPGATSTIITWLEDRPEPAEPEPSQPAPEAEAAAPEPPELTEEGAPSWLDQAAEPDDTPEVAVDPTPSWLAGVAEAASQQASMPEEPEPQVAEADVSEDDGDWLDNLRKADAQAEPEDDAGGEAPDWLEGIDEPEGEAGLDEADAPDWLRGVEEPDVAEPQPTPAPEASKAPDWLRGGDELAPEPGADRANVPDWLQGIAEQGPAIETGADEVPEGAEDAPTWIKDFAGEGETLKERSAEDEIDPQAIQQIEAELSAATEPAPPPEGPRSEGIGVEDELDDEEVFRWLESLADRQEDVQSAAAGSGAGDVAPSAATMSQAAPPEDPDASMQWLEDLAAERGIDVDITPDLAGAAPAKVEHDTKPAEPTPVLPTEPDEEEKSPDWLRDMATAPADETMVSIPRPPIAESPDAVPELPEVAPPVEEPVDQLTEAVAPSQPEADIPDWLDEAATVAADVPAEPAAEPEPVVEESPVAPAPPMVETAQPPTPATPVGAEAETGVETAPPSTSAAQPGKPKRYKEPPTEAEILLQGARQALAAGDAGRALSDYKKMITRKQELDTVIEDLEEALERYPNLPTMWQALGDAYMKADRLSEAIQAYQRGMEVA